jgi:hypothetical protein
MSDEEESGGRITVNLATRAATALRTLQDRTGLSKTDLVNRALTVYEFFDERLEQDELLLRDRRTGAEQTVRFL